MCQINAMPQRHLANQRQRLGVRVEDFVFLGWGLGVRGLKVRVWGIRFEGLGVGFEVLGFRV